MATAIVLLFSLLGVLNAQPYPFEVTETLHPNCAAPRISLEMGTLAVVRGHQEAPCTGYLRYNLGASGIQRMCGSNVSPFGRINFHQQAAQRACYTLGVNMYRPDGFGGNNDDQIMLYTCDEYTEVGVEFPSDDDTIPVAGVNGGIFGSEVAKRCDPTVVNADNACFDECYNTAAGVDDEVEDDCQDLSGPYWAITCSDHNECMNGVLGNCKGPFKSSCTTRPACGNNTDCLNLQGTWSCSCLDGYTLASGNALDAYTVGVGCVDINECEVDGVCGVNGQCVNTPGSYHCICPHPSLWDQLAYRCIGRDECEDDDICGPHGTCQNTIDSYICICPKPELWDEDTKMCLPANCEVLPQLPHASSLTHLLSAPVHGDTIIYTCDPGYHVLLQDTLPSSHYTSYSHYGYSTSSTFQLTCKKNGHWHPYQIPVCLPIQCGDPDVVANADRKGKSFKYHDEVVYTCRTGFHCKDQSYGGKSFTKKCKADGYWSAGTTCVDIDECHDYNSICGAHSQYCINTIGSYMCSCVPWYQSDPNDNRCVEWAGLVDFPHYNPCQIVGSFGGCKKGQCEIVNSKAVCTCDAGYEGTLCDKRIISPGLIVAIVALVLISILLIVCLVCCCCSQGQPCFGHPAPPVVHGGAIMPRKPVMEPMYGPPRRGRPGFFMNRYC